MAVARYRPFVCPIPSKEKSPEALGVYFVGLRDGGHNLRWTVQYFNARSVTRAEISHAPCGNTLIQVESKGKDGKRTLTPVRR